MPIKSISILDAHDQIKVLQSEVDFLFPFVDKYFLEHKEEFQKDVLIYNKYIRIVMNRRHRNISSGAALTPESAEDGMDSFLKFKEDP